MMIAAYAKAKVGSASTIRIHRGEMATDVAAARALRVDATHCTTLPPSRAMM
jgi:hypothetical protein